MSLNPFDAGGREERAEEPSPVLPRKPDSAPDAPHPTVTWDDVAKRLLEKNLILTALELYTELWESGKELKRLRDFFSNPANFEIAQLPSDPRLPRSSSVQTFESLDDSRLSDEGDGVDRLAVVEFELRKARETINTLREQLTCTLGDGVAEVGGVEARPSASLLMSTESVESQPPRPDEIRALNFLVNEYLLLNNNRLTAVTFSEEVPGQDFENWDEVGLNRPRPSDLISIFRAGAYQSSLTTATADFCGGTDLEEEVSQNGPTNAAQLQGLSDELSRKIAAQQQEIVHLTEELRLRDEGAAEGCANCRPSLSSSVQKTKLESCSVPR